MQTATSTSEKKTPAPRAKKTSAVPAPKAVGGRGGSFAGRTVKLVSKPKDGVKLAAQARVVLATLEALGKKATQQEVIDGLIANGLKTKQEPKRIYTFYRQALVDGGYIELG